MSKCPYTWFKSIFKSSENQNSSEANALHVKVIKNGVETVFVSLPARSARWLIEIIPDDVLVKIKEEKIPIEDILNDLKAKSLLHPQAIFKLEEPNRIVDVWLE